MVESEMVSDTNVDNDETTCQQQQQQHRTGDSIPSLSSSMMIEDNANTDDENRNTTTTTRRNHHHRRHSNTTTTTTTTTTTDTTLMRPRGTMTSDSTDERNPDDNNQNSVLDHTTHEAIGYSNFIHTTTATTNTNSSSSNIPSTAEELIALLQRIKRISSPQENADTDSNNSRSLTEIRIVPHPTHRRRPPLPMPFVRSLCTAASHPNCRFLVRLQLNRVGITDHYLETYISKIVCHNPHLKDLDLTKNEITHIGFERFLECCCMTTTNTTNPPPVAKLKRLILEGNSRMTDITPLCTSLLQAQQQQNSFLSELQILKIGKMPLFEDALDPNNHHNDNDNDASSSSHVNHSQNLRAICQSILANPHSTIRKLDLRKTHLGNSGTIQIAQALSSSSSSSLMSLGLGRNHIGDDGMRAMARALRTNTSLTSLDVQGNPDITDASIQEIVECLQYHNSHLQKLKLFNPGNNGTPTTTLPSSPPPPLAVGISNDMRQQLLDVLICNSHGPELAQRTKQARQTIQHQLQIQQQRLSSTTTPPGLLLLQDHSESSSMTMDSSEEGDDDDAITDEWWGDAWCVICYEALSQQCPRCALLPCLHQNCCHACAERLHQCPFCRETIVQIVPMVPTKKYPSPNDENVNSSSSSSSSSFSTFSKYPRSYRRSVVTTITSSATLTTPGSTTIASSPPSAPSISHTPPVSPSRHR
jgi:hypothetical protein